MSVFHRCCLLLLAPLCHRAQRSGPPQTQGVVLPDLPWCCGGIASLAVRGRVTLTLFGPWELPLPTGARQQWHERMNAVEKEFRIIEVTVAAAAPSQPLHRIHLRFNISSSLMVFYRKCSETVIYQNSYLATERFSKLIIMTQEGCNSCVLTRQ